MEFKKFHIVGIVIIVFLLIYSLGFMMGHYNLLSTILTKVVCNTGVFGLSVSCIFMGLSNQKTKAEISLLKLSCLVIFSIYILIIINNLHLIKTFISLLTTLNGVTIIYLILTIFKANNNGDI